MHLELFFCYFILDFTTVLYFGETLTLLIVPQMRSARASTTTNQDWLYEKACCLLREREREVDWECRKPPDANSG